MGKDDEPHLEKYPKVKAWLARHGRFHIHYTPTYASWLDQVSAGSD